MSRRCKPGTQDVRCKNNPFHIFDGNEVPGVSPSPSPTPKPPGPQPPPPPPNPPPPRPLPQGRTGGAGLSPWGIAGIAGGSALTAARLAQASQMGTLSAEATAASEIEMTAVSEEAALSTTTGYSAISEAGLSGPGDVWAGLTTEAAGEGELMSLSAVGEETALLPFEIGGEALALEATGAAAATAGVGLGTGAAIALAAPLTVYALIEFSKNGLFDWYANAHDTSGPPWVEPPPMFASPDQVMAYQMAKSESDAKYYAAIQQEHDDAFNKIVDYAKQNGDPIPSNDKEANDYITSKQAQQLQDVQSVAKANGDPIPVDVASASDYANSHSSLDTNRASTTAPPP